MRCRPARRHAARHRKRQRREPAGLADPDRGDRRRAGRDAAGRRLRGGGIRMSLALVGYYEPWWIQIIKSLLIFGAALGVLPLIIVYERKLLGRFQGRYGPNRVGPYGLLQPLAEIIKFATKEDSRPVTSVGPLYVLAPVISIITAVAAFALVPFGDAPHIFGTRVGPHGASP